VTTEPDDDEGPYVCPGCYAVGGERCADYCVDARMRRELEDEDSYGFLHPYDALSLDDELDEAPFFQEGTLDPGQTGAGFLARMRGRD
jgi:hypothetical protein